MRVYESDLCMSAVVAPVRAIALNSRCAYDASLLYICAYLATISPWFLNIELPTGHERSELTIEN